MREFIHFVLEYGRSPTFSCLARCIHPSHRPSLPVFADEITVYSGSILELTSADLDLILLLLAGWSFFCLPSFILFFYLTFLVRLSMLSSSIYRKHIITAQRASPAQSSKASTRRSELDNASRQTKLARASMSHSIYTARCVKTNENTSKSARPTRKQKRTRKGCSFFSRRTLKLASLGAKARRAHNAWAL